jgi:dihydrofolate reductase
MKLSLIVAMDQKGVIGLNNALPWRLSSDLKNFKAVTMGKPVIMGRKTWESIGKPLPGRHNIVVTRRRDFHLEDAAVSVVHDLDGALAAAGEVDEVMIIGGAEIYALSLPRAKLVELTRVHAEVVGDTRLPEFSAAEWQEVARSEHPADERNDYPMSFITLQRR